MTSTDKEWLDTIHAIMAVGEQVSPRGKLTLEIPQNTLCIDTREPVLTIKDRKLSYQFMAAEAYWIMSGDNRVETIAPYNKNIANFSDDGVTFFGAYGPRILAQLDYVVDKLIEDPSTRQAGLTIWKENPPSTKDVPCTVAMFFGIRDGKLNIHVFMRSSDAWLGVPYDVFNFSMLAHLVCARLNAKIHGIVEPCMLYLTAASSHIYEQNFDAVREVLKNNRENREAVKRVVQTPDILYRDERSLMSWLGRLRDSKPGDSLRWWEV